MVIEVGTKHSGVGRYRESLLVMEIGILGETYH